MKTYEELLEEVRFGTLHPGAGGYNLLIYWSYNTQHQGINERMSEMMGPKEFTVEEEAQLVINPPAWALEKAIEYLKTAKEVLEARGWKKGSYGAICSGPCCLQGATCVPAISEARVNGYGDVIFISGHAGPANVPTGTRQRVAWMVANAVVNALVKDALYEEVMNDQQLLHNFLAMQRGNGNFIALWNDAKNRTRADVTTMLNLAIVKLGGSP